MKCTRCGKEMTIKPVQSGTDEGGESVFTRYAFCYDCKIKVNLDKKKERDTQKKVTAEDVVETKTKKKKKKGKKLPSVSLPKRRGGRGKTRRRIAQVLALSDRCCGARVCSIYLPASHCQVCTADA